MYQIVTRNVSRAGRKKGEMEEEGGARARARAREAGGGQGEIIEGKREK
jgi:hypothetical protein